MPETSIYEQVYGELLQQLPVYRPPKPWRRFSQGGDLRGAPADPTAVLGNLQKRFTVDDLLKTKVAELVDKNELTLSPLLCDSQTVMLGLRSSRERSPFDFMLDSGCLSQRLLPICALMGDGRMRTFLAKSHRPLCITFSMADAAALATLGFPSAVATGLDSVRLSHLDVFRRCFQLDTHDEESPTANVLMKADSDSPWWLLGDVLQDEEFQPPQICLANWSVAELDRTGQESLPAVIAHLDRLNRYLGITLEDFRVWEPSEEEVDRIGFCLEHGCRTDVRAAILQSLAEATSEVITPASERPPKELAEALGQFQEVLSKADADPLQEQLVWQDCQQAMHRELIAPLFAQAEAVPDPVERSFCVAAANVAQLVHAQGMALKSRMLKQGRQSSTASLTKDEVQTLMAMTDRLLKLGKEIQECGTHPIWKLGK